ncbi:MAG: hypothetical protein A2Y38_04305 [Spirochaetes bacterium GWB1_59_5]|nr:MAG: hypothetical protein A2Y38_04305 [Spirochaetes bacterium GWB1_59_5]
MFGVTEDFRVVRTDPGNSYSNIPLNRDIRVYFNQAVDVETLNTGTFIVARNSATPIAGAVRYETNQRGEFIGIFTPQVILHADTTYQVTLVGLSHPITGGAAMVIKSALGYSLGRNFSFVFSTGSVSVQPPVLELPVEYSSITEEKPLFQWTLIAGATNYELEIGTSELMDPLYTPPGSSQTYPITIPGDVDNYTPSDSFERELQYYWRIRTYQAGVFSAWSALYSFYILGLGEDPPYVPPAENFVPVGDPTMLFGGSEEFRVVGTEPAPSAIGVDPDYFLIHFNKAIDEESIDSDTFRCTIRGNKLIDSDPNTSIDREIDIEDAYVDEEDPTILVIIPVGGAAPEE